MVLSSPPWVVEPLGSSKAARNRLGECFGLQALELCLVDRAGIQ